MLSVPSRYSKEPTNSQQIQHNLTRQKMSDPVISIGMAADQVPQRSGKVLWEHHDGNQHHDARRLPNGNTIYIAWEPLDEFSAKRVHGGIPGSEKDGIIYGDVIREITPEKEVVWEWRTKEMEIENYPICPLCPRAEFAHANTVSPLANGDILVSFRVLNTIILIDRKTRKIKWEHKLNFF